MAEKMAVSEIVTERPMDTSRDVYTNISNRKNNVPAEVDLGNLLVSEIAVIDDDQFAANRELYLRRIACNNVRVLLDSLSKLPTEVVDDISVVKLPESTTLVPREKPVPKPKPLTRWEKFARQKGIRKHKKDKIAFDETTRTWRPTYGYQKANDAENPWLVEVPDNADPNQDFFAKLEEKKQERVAKNEFNRLRNVARAANVKVPAVGTAPRPEGKGRKRAADFLNEATLAKEATASTGKFQPSLPKEKTDKKRQRKQQFEPNIQDADGEKQRALTLLNRILNKKPAVNIEKAANRHIHEEEMQQADDKRTGSGDYSRKAKMSKRRSKAGEHTLNRKATAMKNDDKKVWKKKTDTGGKTKVKNSAGKKGKISKKIKGKAVGGKRKVKK